MVVSNRNVGCGAGVPGFDGYIVIAGANVGISDGNVGRGGGIYAISVTSGGRSINAHAPGGETIGFVHDHVEIRRVAQRNAIQGEVIRRIDDCQTRTVLSGVADFGLMSKVPPAYALVEQVFPALAVNAALTHNAAMGSILRMDQRLASMSFLIHYAAGAGTDVIFTGVAGGKQSGAACNQQCNGRP